MAFCSCSFSLMFYGINFLRPASGSFLYLVSKGRSAERIEWDNWYHFIMLCLPISAKTPKE